MSLPATPSVALAYGCAALIIRPGHGNYAHAHNESHRACAGCVECTIQHGALRIYECHWADRETSRMHMHVITAFQIGASCAPFCLPPHPRAAINTKPRCVTHHWQAWHVPCALSFRGRPSLQLARPRPERRGRGGTAPACGRAAVGSLARASAAGVAAGAAVTAAGGRSGAAPVTFN